MRTFIFLFCVVTFGFTPKNGFSQNDKIYIEKNNELTVNQVFDLIIEQTQYNFIYRKDLFVNAPKIQLKKGTIRAKKLLEKCLSKSEFTYVFTDDKTIILTKVGNLVLPKETIQKSITGKITDKEGNGLPGVTVIEKGTNRGVSSSFLGEYKIIVEGNNPVLVFSFVGFTSKEIVVGNQTEINVILEESIQKLKTVQLISTGYQKIAKEKMTGSAENIDNSYYENSNKTTLQEGLQGSVSGLQIFSNNSHPQATPQVIIRGVGSAFQEGVGYVGFGAPTTVLGSPIVLTPGSPLYVIDGVPTFDGKDLSSINGNDIASISVLINLAAKQYAFKQRHILLIYGEKSEQLFLDSSVKISYEI